MNKTSAEPVDKANELKLKKTFFHKLTEAQKGSIALGMTVLIVILIGGGIFAYKNQKLINTLLGKNEPEKVVENSDDRPALRAAAENLSKTLSRISNDTILYQTINFEDLPIYPQSWVEKYFNSNEVANALVGGATADPDNDGLSNKQEYLYGSDPRNPDTLCNGKIDNKVCVGRNDKENVDAGISPLTGLDLGTARKIKIKKQDLAVVGKLQSSFETASKEGVDFPSLYQLSKLIDLSDEMNKLTVNTVDETAQGLLEYQQFRVKILGEFANDDEFSSFTKIYELSTPKEFDEYIKNYSDIFDELQAANVPKRYEQAHRAYMLLFQKLKLLVQHRKDGVLAGSVGPEFKDKSKQLSTEMVWAYRRLNEELVKASDASQG